MTNIKNFFVLLIIATLMSCSSWQNESAPHAWLTPGNKINLPTPTLANDIDRQQLLTVTINGKSDSLLTMLNVSQDKITLVGLSLLGIRLFKVIYDETGIKTEQAIALPQLPPANQVLSDIMLSYWPIEVWRNNLPDGWRLEEESNHRSLYDTDGRLIIGITYQMENNRREPIMIEHYYFGYQIAIQNMK